MRMNISIEKTEDLLSVRRRLRDSGASSSTSPRLGIVIGGEEGDTSCLRPRHEPSIIIWICLSCARTFWRRGSLPIPISPHLLPPPSFASTLCPSVLSCSFVSPVCLACLSRLSVSPICLTVRFTRLSLSSHTSPITLHLARLVHPP